MEQRRRRLGSEVATYLELEHRQQVSLVRLHTDIDCLECAKFYVTFPMMSNNYLGGVQ